VSSSKNFFPGYDGNGNVTVLVEASTGAMWANYEYGPFGELTRSTGSMAMLNSFRFSTKYQDDETDYLYYGYRYYSPIVGRWLRRDIIWERGGFNLYAANHNDCVNRTDRLGLKTVKKKCGVKSFVVMWSPETDPKTTFPGWQVNTTIEFREDGDY